MASLQARFAFHWQEKFAPFHPGNTQLLVALSGGMDSVVLLHLLINLGFPLSVAHVNYGLRGADSQADEDLVRQLAGQHQLSLFVEKADPAQIKEGNVQANARAFRYAFFQRVQEQLRTPRRRCLLVTAHHLDDQAETVLLQQLRGAGLQGLAGMKAQDTDRGILRPLLPFSRAELAAYAMENSLPWREDQSNQTTQYRRNWLRHEVMPLLATQFPLVASTLAANAERLQEAQLLYQTQLARQLRQLVKQQPDGQRQLSIAQWRNHPARQTILWELLHPLGLSAAAVEEWSRILLNAETDTAQWQEANCLLLKDRQRMLICPIGQNDDAPVVIDSITSFPLRVGGHLLRLLGTKPFPGKESLTVEPNEAWLPLEKMEWPLLLRQFETGDYFYPLGLGKKKKIARFLMDEKLNAIQKADTWLLCSGNYIAWIAGRRSDHRFAAKPGQPCLHLRWD